MGDAVESATYPPRLKASSTRASGSTLPENRGAAGSGPGHATRTGRRLLVTSAERTHPADSVTTANASQVLMVMLLPPDPVDQKLHELVLLRTPPHCGVAARAAGIGSVDEKSRRKSGRAAPASAGRRS